MAADEWAKVGRYFDGQSQYIEMPGPPLGEKATIEGWFVWLAGEASLLRDCSEGSGWSLGYSDGGFLTYSVSGRESTTNIAVETLSRGWHHYVLTREGPHVEYHLDGESVDVWEGASPTPPQLPWRVMRDGLTDRYIEGFAADIAMYERRLPPEAIRRHWVVGRERY